MHKLTKDMIRNLRAYRKDKDDGTATEAEGQRRVEKNQKNEISEKSFSYPEKLKQKC